MINVQCQLFGTLEYTYVFQAKFCLFGATSSNILHISKQIAYTTRQAQKAVAHFNASGDL